MDPQRSKFPETSLAMNNNIRSIILLCFKLHYRCKTSKYFGNGIKKKQTERPMGNNRKPRNKSYMFG